MIESCLITGGAGFVGANLSDRYLLRGARVIVVDSLSDESSVQNLEWLFGRHGGRLEVIQEDVRVSGQDLVRAVDEVDVVFHLAEQAGDDGGLADPREDFEVNALGTLNVLEAVRISSSRPTLIYGSNSRVYGALPDMAVQETPSRYVFAHTTSGVTEARPLSFNSPYGCSKGAGDQYVLDYSRSFGLRTVVFRQSCVYGPHQFGRETEGWLAWFAIRNFQGLPVVMPGNGKLVRDFLYIDDLLDAYDSAIEHIDTAAGQAYNIGGGPHNTLSMLELVDLLNSHFGQRLAYSCVEWHPNERRIYVSDIRKAQKELGWSPQVGVRAGVARLTEWIRENEGLFLVWVGIQAFGS